MTEADRIECRKLALEIAADLFDASSVICGARYLAHFLEHGSFHPEIEAQHASSGASVVEFVAKGK